MLGLRVAKTASFTRWDARPLSPEQLAYAREDVVHLLELASELERRLAELGRLQWAREECEPLARSSDERDLEAIFARLPRIGDLNASARPIARELVELARAHRRAPEPARAERAGRRHAGGDRQAQAVLARRARADPRRRRERRRAPGAGAARGGPRAGASARRIRRCRRTRPPAPKPDDAPLVALGEALLRARAREAGLAYELLAARADLQAIVAAARAGGEEADVRTLRGWRRELAGAELLELLDGQRLAVGAVGRAGRVDRRDTDRSPDRLA